MLRTALAAVLAALVLAPATANAAAVPSVTLAFLPVTVQDNNLYFQGGTDEPRDQLLQGFGYRPQLSLGLMSTVQGDYNESQSLLDISQGTRQSAGLYTPRTPNSPLYLDAKGDGGPGQIVGWDDAVARAGSASVTIEPGLLAGSIPGGAAYVGIALEPNVEAIAAADRSGHISAVSIGSADTVAARADEMRKRYRLVVVSLPPVVSDLNQLDELIRTRPRSEELMVFHLPPTPVQAGFGKPPIRYLNLTAFAIAGLKTGQLGGAATSATTRQNGLVALIDVLPTALDHLGITMPDRARGTVITKGPARTAQQLQDQRRRWSDTRGGRQKASIRTIVAIGLLLTLVLSVWRGLGWGLRVGLRLTALSLFWWPTLVLVSGLLDPSLKRTELAIIAVGSFVMAAITDRTLRWPRGPAAPAAAAIASYTAVLVAFAFGGLFIGFVMGWGRLGADVGGVLTAGFAAIGATLVMLPGGINKRVIGIAILVPVAAIAALIVLDLLSGGNGHLSRNLSRATSPTDLWELVSRRYRLSFNAFFKGLTPFITGFYALAVVFAYRNRSWLFAPLNDAPWRAVLVGGLFAGIGGALTNDSGPVLFVNAIFALLAVTAYIQGVPTPLKMPGEGATPTEPKTPLPASTGTSAESALAG
ncbi:MAG: hypothetical protein NTV40_06375 [Solirubrobacterales bacterium]|nr:hypothetical protein [Solirubrobacterales bacterium]